MGETLNNLPPIEAQRAVLLDVLQRLAAFGHERTERRARMSVDMRQTDEQPVRTDDDES